MTDKVTENRIRRMAERQGLTLLKSRRRDPRAIDFNGFMLTDAATNIVVIGADSFAYSCELDEIERFLNADDRSEWLGTSKSD
jgi:hypothetical protein